MPEHIPVITIDGPSGTGKGTVSQLIANQLGWAWLDSGSLYRVLGMAATQQKIALDDEKALSALARDLDVQFAAAKLGESAQIVLEGEDVSEAIRTEACAMVASKIATLSAVREGLMARQKAFRKSPGLVADGRDMGTVVFTDAILKIFLTASSEERAKRRHQQLKNKGIDVNLADILREIEARDTRDTSRTVVPLRPAKDAVVIDTTELSIDEVVSQVMGELNFAPHL